MTSKRVVLGIVLVLLLSIGIYFALRIGGGTESLPPNSSKISQFKNLLEPPISPQHLSRSIKLIYAMGNERQTEELLEAAATIEAMRLAEPEVWSSLVFVLIISASNIHREDPEWRWKWVRQGLLTCRKGFDLTGGHLDLASDLAFHLKIPTGLDEPGSLEVDLISRIEADPELQKVLAAPDSEHQPENPVSPYVLAMGWVKYVRDKILSSTDATGHTMKAGLRLTPVNQEAYVRSLCYLEAMYQWRKKDFLKASQWLKSAEDQCETILRMDPQASPRIKEWRGFYRDLRPIVILDQRASEKGLNDPEQRTILEQALQQAEALFANAKDQQGRTDLDEGFVQGFISRCKQALR